MFYENELMIILKATKMRDLTFTIENTFSEKPDKVGGQIDSPEAFLAF